MNKYQQALNDLYNPKLVNAMNPLNVEVPNSYIVLQELVDMQAPLKVVNKNIENQVVDGYIPLVCGECPQCGWEDLIEVHSYCSNCGQKLDWT